MQQQRKHCSKALFFEFVCHLQDGRLLRFVELVRHFSERAGRFFPEFGIFDSVQGSRIWHSTFEAAEPRDIQCKGTGSFESRVSMMRGAM